MKSFDEVMNYIYNRYSKDELMNVINGCGNGCSKKAIASNIAKTIIDKKDILYYQALTIENMHYIYWGE